MPDEMTKSHRGFSKNSVENVKFVGKTWGETSGHRLGNINRKYSAIKDSMIFSV